MKKGNIIDLIMYRDQRTHTEAEAKTTISHELQEAIENLIDNLKNSVTAQVSRSK